jgi:hypothetical protein
MKLKLSYKETNTVESLLVFDRRPSLLSVPAWLTMSNSGSSSHSTQQMTGAALSEAGPTRNDAQVVWPRTSIVPSFGRRWL